MDNIFYAFDVDGTICFPREKMEDDFSEYFYGFCCKNNVILVSGSSIEMLKEQIPYFIQEKVKIYGCSGIEGNSLNIEDNIEDEELITVLQSYLEKTNFKVLTGNHIEIRKGMINFSICGRNANPSQRKLFEEYDSKMSERLYFCKELKKLFGHKYNICLGGSTSIDITKLGIDKSLVAKDLLAINSNPTIIFFGDGILNNGNDYPLAKYISENNLGYSTQIDYSQMKKNYKRILV